MYTSALGPPRGGGAESNGLMDSLDACSGGRRLRRPRRCPRARPPGGGGAALAVARRSVPAGGQPRRCQRPAGRRAAIVSAAAGRRGRAVARAPDRRAGRRVRSAHQRRPRPPVAARRSGRARAVPSAPPSAGPASRPAPSAAHRRGACRRGARRPPRGRSWGSRVGAAADGWAPVAVARGGSHAGRRRRSGRETTNRRRIGLGGHGAWRRCPQVPLERAVPVDRRAAARHARRSRRSGHGRALPCRRRPWSHLKFSTRTPESLSYCQPILSGWIRAEYRTRGQN